MNPITKKPFCDKMIRKVFESDCYDFDPDRLGIRVSDF